MIPYGLNSLSAKPTFLAGIPTITAFSGTFFVITALANAVITKNVPEKAVMVGIPAKNVGLADSEFKPYGITPDSDTKSD